MVVNQNDLAVPKNATSLKDFKASFVLSPEQWSRYVALEQLAWTSCPVTKSDIDSLPNDKYGIYSFVIVPPVAGHGCSYLMYVGMAKDQPLRTRVGQYLREAKSASGRGLIKELFRRWENYLRVYYATVSNCSLLEEIEDRLILAFIPPCNDKLPARCGGAIKAVWR